jgi:hypothetical protein
MASSACLPALLLAAGIVAIAAPRIGLSPGPWSARARARMPRVATAVLTGSFAVALALSLVGINGEGVDASPTMPIWILVSIAIAAFLIRRSRGSGAEPR